MASFIVRIVSLDEAGDRVTCYVGPIEDFEQALDYADEVEAHHAGEVELAVVETLHALPES